MTNEERIKADAEALSGYNENRGDGGLINKGRYYGYIAGATAELAHMKPVIDAAEKVAKIFAHKDGNCAICELARAIEQLKGKEPDRPCPHCGKELSRDRNLCCRECGEEVKDENSH